MTTWSRRWAVLEPIVGVLGGILSHRGLSCAILEVTLSSLGPSWRHLGPSWAISGLMASGTRILRNLRRFPARPSWRHLGLGSADLLVFYKGLWPPGRSLGGLVGRLGALLGRLGALLGVSWAVLGPSWSNLRPSWRLLGFGDASLLYFTKVCGLRGANVSFL